MKTQKKLPSKARIRKHLNADALYSKIYKCFKQIPDHRKADCNISLADALMSGFAMFALKDPSLYRFDKKRHNEAEAKNLQTVFGIKDIPADTTMTEIIDPVEPEALRPSYKAVFEALQRGKALVQMTFLDKYFLISPDGTGIHFSESIGSETCQIRVNKETGLITYYQQMLGAAMFVLIKS